jgi:hypothetical protein
MPSSSFRANWDSSDFLATSGNNRVEIPTFRSCLVRYRESWLSSSPTDAAVKATDKLFNHHIQHCHLFIMIASNFTNCLSYTKIKTFVWSTLLDMGKWLLGLCCASRTLCKSYSTELHAHILDEEAQKLALYGANLRWNLNTWRGNPKNNGSSYASQRNVNTLLSRLAVLSITCGITFLRPSLAWNER